MTTIAVENGTNGAPQKVSIGVQVANHIVSYISSHSLKPGDPLPSELDLAEELGVSANSVNRWMKQFRQQKDEAFPGKGRQTSQAALISRLRRENERLRKERDFLKKTASYFAAKNESDTE